MERWRETSLELNGEEEGGRKGGEEEDRRRIEMDQMEMTEMV